MAIFNRRNLVLLFLCLWLVTAQGLAQSALRNLVAFTPNLEKALISVSEDQRELVFRLERDFSQSRLAMIAVDSLLLAPAGKRFPDGLAVRVQRMVRGKQTLRIEAVPVTISDLTAHHEGIELALGPADVEEVHVEPLLSEMPAETEALPLMSIQGFDPPGSVDRGKSHSGPWAKVRESAVFSTGARLAWDANGISGNARLKVENPRLVFKRDQLSFSGRVVVDAGLGFRPARNLMFKYVLLNMRLQPIPLGMIGPIPLYVRPRLRILVKGRVSGSIGCSGSFSMSAPFVTGARREAGVWKNLSKASVTAEPHAIRLDGTVGELTAKLFVGAAVDFFINDLAGPTLRTGFYISPGAAATLVSSPEGSTRQQRPVLSVFKVKGGAELSIGGALSFLDHAHLLVDVVRVEVPLYKLKLAGVEVEPRRWSVLPGQGVEISDLHLIPLYSQRLLEKDQGLLKLGRLPGTWGNWQPAPDVRETLPGLSRGTRQEYSCSLSLLDKAWSLAPGSFELIANP